MVSIFQSMKVSLLFILFGLIPFIIAVIALISLITMGFGFGFDEIYVASGEDIGKALALLGLFTVASFIFFIGLFKAIGDITEAALLE